MNSPLALSMHLALKTIFSKGSVKYGVVEVPTYPSGSIGVLLCRKHDTSRMNVRDDVSVPIRTSKNTTMSEGEYGRLKHYNETVHGGVFVVGERYRKVLEGGEEEEGGCGVM